MNVTKGRRLIRLEQFSPLTMRFFCSSTQRAYRTIGEASNRSWVLTKSIRSFRWMCPCNKRKPITAVFDSQSGYIGKVEYISCLENIILCQQIHLRVYDHMDNPIMFVKFPRLNLVSCFGLYPCQQFDKIDFKFSRISDSSQVVLVRK